MKMKNPDLAIKDLDEHVKILAHLVLQLQTRILNINSPNSIELSQVANDTLQSVADIGMLKLRELCSFLIKSGVIKEENLRNILEGFMEYQTEIGKKTEMEIKAIYSKAKLLNKVMQKENPNKDSSLSEDYINTLNNYKGEKIH